MVHSSVVCVVRGDETICSASANIREDSDRWVHACEGTCGCISAVVDKWTYNKINVFSSKRDEIEWRVRISCTKCDAHSVKNYGNTGFDNDDYAYVFTCKCNIYVGVSIDFSSALGGLWDVAKRHAVNQFRLSNKCSTSFHFKHNCEGRERQCPHCDMKFCEYHFDYVDHALVASGGHVCPNRTKGGKVAEVAYTVAKVGVIVGATVVTAGTAGALATAGTAAGYVAGAGAVSGFLNPIECNTNQITKLNCSGHSRNCGHCQAIYCIYHFHPVSDIATVTGGHVCPNYTAGAGVGKIVDYAVDAALIVGTANSIATSAATSAASTGVLKTAFHGGKAGYNAYSTANQTVDVVKKN